MEEQREEPREGQRGVGEGEGTQVVEVECLLLPPCAWHPVFVSANPLPLSLRPLVPPEVLGGGTIRPGWLLTPVVSVNDSSSRRRRSSRSSIRLRMMMYHHMMLIVPQTLPLSLLLLLLLLLLVLQSFESLFLLTVLLIRSFDLLILSLPVLLLPLSPSSQLSG